MDKWYEIYMPGDFVWVHVRNGGYHFAFPGVVSYLRDGSVAVDVIAHGETDRVEITEENMLSRREDDRELTATGLPWGERKCNAVFN